MKNKNRLRIKKKKFSAFGGALVVLVVLVAGLVGKERFGNLLNKWTDASKVSRQIQGEIFGSMPSPTQPSMNEPIQKIVTQEKTRKMVVKRIPRLTPGKKMPHTYWGPCIKCHLIKGGAPAGSQPITPVGKAWEKASSSIMKVGPPILPDTTRNHPPAGRCIKCHDIVVKIPI
ncbi:MAG: magnetochrome domain-containing protein [Magnetococcales bacterium]|nr:magnetochrome domain-containing protein [Magnetococcales bacterium]